jgi:hypothetical protein
MESGMADVIEDVVVVVAVAIRDHDKEPCQNQVDSGSRGTASQDSS